MFKHEKNEGREMGADLLPCQIQSLILLLVQLLDGLKDFCFVVLNNPLLLHQVIVLNDGRQITLVRRRCPKLEFNKSPKPFCVIPHPFFCLIQHVHGPLVDVPLQLGGGFLQLLQPLTSLAGVVGLKVVGGVGLAEELALGVDPIVLLQHSRHLDKDSMTRLLCETFRDIKCIDVNEDWSEVS